MYTVTIFEYFFKNQIIQEFNFHTHGTLSIETPIDDNSIQTIIEYHFISSVYMITYFQECGNLYVHNVDWIYM